jgi:hypothetical protein
MASLTLSLWVSDQPEGTDGDCTALYVRAARFTPADGVTHDPDAVTLSGDDPETVYAEFRRLAALVAAVGHGEDADGNDLHGVPTLTACPVELIEGGWRSAAETLARQASTSAPTYAEWSAIQSPPPAEVKRAADEARRLLFGE